MIYHKQTRKGINRSAAKATKAFVKQPYTWPGCYPLFAITKDCTALCHNCVKNNLPTILEEIRTYSTGWAVQAIDVNWEDTDLYCDNCNKPIESAYGEREET